MPWNLFSRYLRDEELHPLLNLKYSICQILALNNLYFFNLKSIFFVFMFIQALGSLNAAKSNKYYS